MKESQKERVLAYLKQHGSITQAEAVNLFGCYRLGARIWDLKRDGHDISTRMVQEKNRYGVIVTFAEYRLNAGQGETACT